MAEVRERVLVTGGGGFLGAHLVRALASDGARVSLLVRRGADLTRLEDVRGAVETIEGDVTNYASLLEACRKAMPTTIFHLAANTAVRHFDGDWRQVDLALDVNFHGTVNLVRAATEAGAPMKSFVRTGGLEEYGDGAKPSDETQREQPSSPYSASQVAATHWCRTLQPYLGFAVVTLRPALLYGPAQGTTFLIPALITALLRGERFATSEGRQVRDLVYVDDAVRALRLAAQRPDLRGAVVNVASGNDYRVRDVVELIARQLGRPELIDIGAVTPRGGEGLDVWGRCELAAALLGWRADTDLETGMARTIAWYRERARL